MSVNDEVVLTVSNLCFPQEQEEEQKRASLERASREPTMTLDEAEKNLEKTLDKTLSEEVLEERLLSQTDDAKVEEQAKVRDDSAG